MKDQPIISLREVTKEYILRGHRPTLVENLLGRVKQQKTVALNKLSVDIYRGQKVGIVGPNGSGKTTFLKIISDISDPTYGQLKVEGKVVSVIDLEAGFHPDLSGRENIMINGMILGMTKKEVLAKMTKIIDFADIGNFIEEPIFTYSKGMKLRLGFSIAINSDPDIFLLDEMIAVGDEEFKIKTAKKVDSFLKQGKVVVIASHLIDFIGLSCKRIIWLEKGKIMADGGKEVIKKYKKYKQQKESSFHDYYPFLLLDLLLNNNNLSFIIVNILFFLQY
jgi:ABC-type polysaccharide/polyol phosphate transport system ATPase subunit